MHILIVIQINTIFALTYGILIVIYIISLKYE